MFFFCEAAHHALKVHAHTHVVSSTLSVLHTHGVTHMRHASHARTVRQLTRTRTLHAACHVFELLTTRAHACTPARPYARTRAGTRMASHTRTTHRMHAQCFRCHAHVLDTLHVTYMSCSQHARTHAIAVYITPGPDVMRDVTPSPLATLFF